MTSYQGHVATPQDAVVLLEACRVGYIPSCGKRLTEAERDQLIQSGSVFVWTEDGSQVKRWTDGRKWSPSRIHGPFLVYWERPSPGEKSQRPLFVKKAVSVNLANGQRLHLVSYYYEQDAPHLLTPSTDDRFNALNIDNQLYPEMTRESLYKNRGGQYAPRNVAPRLSDTSLKRPSPQQSFQEDSASQLSDLMQLAVAAEEMEREIYTHRSPQIQVQQTRTFPTPIYYAEPNLSSAVSTPMSTLPQPLSLPATPQEPQHIHSTFNAATHATWRPATGEKDVRQLNTMGIRFLLNH